jgi:hypothetical protein
MLVTRESRHESLAIRGLMYSLKQSQLFQLLNGSVNRYQSKPGIAYTSSLENFEWIEHSLAGGHDLDNGMTRSGQAISIFSQALKPV